MKCCVMVLFAVLTTAPGCADRQTGPSDDKSQAPTAFTYDNKPISPHCVVLFLGDVVKNGPGDLAAVSLDALSTRDVVEDYPARLREGDWYGVDLPGGGGERFEYRHVGRSPGGLHVLQTLFHTGGTMVDVGVMLLTLEEDRLFDGAARHKLIFKGYIDFGDRIYRDVKLVGNRLHLGPGTSPLPLATTGALPGPQVIDLAN